MRGLLWTRLHDLTGNAFEEFFQDLMVLCSPGFVDVRTHGNIGDLASDGLELHQGKLYACYAPETPNAAATTRKFASDLAGAKEKRAGQFSTFVFVHNDVRGTHPEVSAALAEARTKHPELQFEVMGMRHFRDLMGPRDRQDVENLLRSQLPLQHAVAVGLQEMEELLARLASKRLPSDAAMTIEPVSANKLCYSDLTEESQAEIRDGMKYTPVIDGYYRERIDVTERDDVAARFQTEYLDAAATTQNPEDTLLRLREFLAGSRLQAAPSYRAQTAVLAYFFETCDIFKNAPDGWQPPALMVL